MNNIPLLRLILSKFFGDSNNSFVDMISHHIPSPIQSSCNKISKIYNFSEEPNENEKLLRESMLKNDKNGPLIINIVKNYESQDGSNFESLGRVFSGTVRKGDRLRILGEGYTVKNFSIYSHYSFFFIFLFLDNGRRGCHR